MFGRSQQDNRVGRHLMPPHPQPLAADRTTARPGASAMCSVERPGLLSPPSLARADRWLGRHRLEQLGTVVLHGVDGFGDGVDLERGGRCHQALVARGSGPESELPNHTSRPAWARRKPVEELRSPT